LVSGRLKAGGIQFAETLDQVEAKLTQLLGSRIKGFEVEKVLIEERLEITRELYLAVIVSDSYKVKGPVMLFCSEGGIDIEDVATRAPSRVAKLPVDYTEHVTKEKIFAELVSKADFDASLGSVIGEKIAEVGQRLYKVFKATDARIAEINPLVLTKDNNLVAADCRITVDDHSVFRHKEFNVLIPRDMDRPPTELEKIAWLLIEEDDYRGTGYFAQLHPNLKGENWIGFHGIGGGGAMLAATALLDKGFKIANYADTSGDPPASKIYLVIKTIFSLPIDGYILMGAILANQEQWHHAHAIVKALKEEARQRPGFPVVILIAGNKEKEAHDIIRNGLRDVPLQWELYGRDYIYKTDFIASRMEELIKHYKNGRG
ncbi:MAG: ATP-grasp domain-containing protein, partial [Candidatus Hadarchaeum sp.]